jgi:hypothetical protein
MTTTYKNPWHKPGKPEYGPAEFRTDARPVAYRGYLIYERIIDHCWDQVLNGVCRGQNAGPRGARQHIDEMLDA